MRRPTGRQRSGAPQRRQPPAAQAELGLALYTHSPEAVIVIDSRHRLLGLNPAAEQLLGCTLPELRGLAWRQVFQLERELALDYRDNPIARCLSTRQTVRLPSNTILQCGAQRRPVVGQVSPWRQGQQRLALLFLQSRLFLGNNTPNQDQQQSLREHEALLAHMFRLNTMGELATGLAHEINQPLSAILSYSQAALRLLHDEEPDYPRAAHAILEVADQARRAGDIIRQLRAFVSRQRTGFAPVALNQLIMNALTLLAGPLQQQGIQVSIRTEPCPPVLADAIQVEQVLVNLVRNAIEALQQVPAEQRRLRLASGVGAGHVWVEVADQGPGFNAETLGRLFTRFYSTKAEGMGLGLCISQTIIEAAGGELWAGHAPEGGALFRFHLPLAPQEETRHEP